MANGNAPTVVSQAPQAVRQAVLSGLTRVRRNVQQANITALADAYAKMQARSENDGRSWLALARIHGFNGNLCWHHSNVGSQHFPYDLFLPWHRAYLLRWEQTALAINSGATLPWWDWTSTLSHQSGLPAAFTSNASLKSGPVPPGLRTNPPRTTRNPKPPSQLPSAQTIENILNLSLFEDFSGQVQGEHDRVHGWVRGDMGVVAASAFDPIFWSHHCMIDRLWYLWQVRHGISNIPTNYLNKVLTPWNLTVADVLDTRALGYTYGASRVFVAADRFNAVKLAPTG